MVSLKFNEFIGEFPAVDDTALPPNAASYADNIEYGSGVLQGIRRLKLIKDFKTNEFYRHIFRLRKTGTPKELLYPTQGTNVSVLRSPLTEDSFYRFYRTKTEVGANMRVATYDDIETSLEQNPLTDPFVPVAVPRPTSAPTATALDPPGGADPAETRVYVVVWQTEWGEESEPSPPVTVSVTAGTGVDLSGISLPDPNALEGRAWTGIDIYRTVIGTDNAEFYWVAEIAIDQATYQDVTDSSLVVYNRQLQSFRNEPPPADLHGLVVHPSGALCGHVGNEVWFSKPYLPHAWPSDQRISLSDQVVGLAPVGSELFVITDGRPAIIYGQDVAGLGVRYLSAPNPCVNPESIAVFRDGVAYAGPFGLLYMTSGGVTNLTESVIDRLVWEQDFLPGGLIYGAAYENNYLGLAYKGLAFSFNVQEPQEGLRRFKYPLDERVQGFIKDQHGPAILVLVGDAVYEWDVPTEPPEIFTWRSKIVTLPRPLNFSCCQAVYRRDNSVDAPFLWAKITADGRVAFRGYLRGDSEVHRLNAGWKAYRWQVEVVGNVELAMFAMAQSIEELKNA